MPTLPTRAMSRVAIVTVLLVAATSIIGAQSAAAAPVVDQSATVFDAGSRFGFYEGVHYEAAQTFTAGKSGQLTGIRLLLGGDGDTTLRVLDGGVHGAVLGTTTIPAAGFGDQVISLAQPVTVTAGRTYAFSLSTTGDTSLGMATTDVYAGGSAHWKASTSAYSEDWSISSRELFFETYVDQASNTVPSISGTPSGRYTTGNAFDFTYTVGGNPTPTVTLTDGQLPPGLSVDSAGRMTGSPTAAGTYYYVLTASNGWGEPAAVTSYLNIFDAVAPSTPGAPTVTSGNGTLTVSWAASTPGDHPLTTYTASTADGASCTTTSLSCVITGLSNGTTYSVSVTASSTAGSRPPSASTTGTPVGPPLAPTGVQATPGDGQVSIDWSAPGDGGAAVQGYQIQQLTNGQVTRTRNVSARTRSTVFTGLTNGAEYQFRVRAENAAGPGAWSTVAAAIPRTVPAAPTISSVVPGDGVLVLSWNAPNDGGSPITTYLIQSSSTPGWWGPSVSIRATSSRFFAPNGFSFDFRIAAVNAAGTGPWSTIASGTPRTLPDAPDWDEVTPGDGQVQLAWLEPATGGAAISEYESQWSLDGTTWTDLDSSTGLVTTIDGLTNGIEHRFRVRAINDAGPGAWSDVTASTPFLFAPRFSTPDGTPLDGATLTAGSAVVVSGSDVPAGATLTLEFHSDPVTLATATVAADGTFQLRGAIPLDAVGAHELVITLSDTGAAAQTARIAVTVTAANSLVTAGADGAELLGWAFAIVLIGTGLAYGGRRSRRPGVGHLATDESAP